MPILVRPVREQLEHDRIIRLLEAKYRRKFRVEINPGDERTASLKVGALTLFPDLILTDDSGRKPYAVVEVETSESVNHLEAMSQWANLAKSKAYLYLYVPAGSVETARRLSADHQIELTELVSYLGIGDQVRFTSVFKLPTPDPIPFKTPPPEKKVAVKKPAEPVAEAVELVAAKAEKPEVDKAVAAKLAPVKGIEKPAAKIATKVAAKAPAKKEAVEKKSAPPAKVAASAKPVGSAAKTAAPAKPPVKAPAPARPVAPAAAKRRATEPPRRAAAPASKHAAPAKRAAASRTTTRAATKRTPPRAANHRPAVKAKPAQKRK